MTVISESPICLKIRLNKAELKKYFISYNNIRFNGPAVKKAICRLFELATRTADFEKSQKQTVEIYPTAYGGCIIKYTAKPQTKAFESYEKSVPYVFSFKNFEDLLNALRRIKGVDKQSLTDTSLYFKNKKYFLALKSEAILPCTAILLKEYSEYCVKGEFSLTALTNYTECLLPYNAIALLKKGFLN